MSETDNRDGDPSWNQKILALYRVVEFQPLSFVLVVVLAVSAAMLEGIGLTFIDPIIEMAQSESPGENAGGLVGGFLTVYERLGIPFTLGYLVAGVTTVMIVRYTISFLVGWFRATIETQYVRHLQEEGFTNALYARTAYFDEEGSDDILNAIVTQAEYAGRVIRYVLYTVEQAFLAGMYFVVAFYLAPILTIATTVFLGITTYLFRNVLGAGYSLGDKVADAKEQIQSNAQAGTQGIRDVKLFGMVEELRSQFVNSVDKFEYFRIKLLRNESAIGNFYQLMTAVSVFALIYLALTFSAMTVGELGVFLFAMYRLGPQVSELNKNFYRVEGELPHLVRTQQFIQELKNSEESQSGLKPVSTPIHRFEFDNVCFSYDSSDENVLDGISFEFNRGEFVGFVGQSGAGKSTIASLLARLYEPDQGEIIADGTPIDEFDIQTWRSRISLVRQDPHIFNETLYDNITIGNRDATMEEVKQIADIAKITEFLEELPDGYDTVLGTQGVKLSGGQRQRVAIARALLKDADLLILDEATSDLDTSLEREVHEAIETMDRDHGMLVIAHRLSTITDADRIYTMEDGSIREVGPHEELLSRNGTYSHLYSMQSS